MNDIGPEDAKIRARFGMRRSGLSDDDWPCRCGVRNDPDLTECWGCGNARSPWRAVRYDPTQDTDPCPYSGVRPRVT